MPILRGLTPPAAHVKKKNFSMSAACLGCGALVADLSGNRLLAVGLSADPRGAVPFRDGQSVRIRKAVRRKRMLWGIVLYSSFHWHDWICRGRRPVSGPDGSACFRGKKKRRGLRTRLWYCVRLHCALRRATIEGDRTEHDRTPATRGCLPVRWDGFLCVCGAGGTPGGRGGAAGR